MPHSSCTPDAVLRIIISATIAITITTASTHAETETARPVSAGAPPVNDGLPMPGFEIVPGMTAIEVTDPQNDFLSPEGVTWGVIGQSVTANGTVENIELLFQVAGETGMPVFVSPHYYFEHDHRWKFEGTLERLMHSISMFDRPSALNLEGFEGSGADWLDRYKPYIENGETVVTSPHKVYGPDVLGRMKREDNATAEAPPTPSERSARFHMHFGAGRLGLGVWPLPAWGLECHAAKPKSPTASFLNGCRTC